jgi:nuclear transport factor 2 (NTF2) superfamily protein
MEQRQPLPPFSLETALIKIKAAEDAWNSKDPIRVSKAYTINSEWRKEITQIYAESVKRSTKPCLTQNRCYRLPFCPFI